MSLSLPNCPTSIKPIQHYLKIATEHEKRDPVITYWCRLAALQNGMSLDKSSKVRLHYRKHFIFLFVDNGN